MANLLAIDWDRRLLHVAAVRTARKAVVVEKVVTWEMPEELTAASADGLGKRLRDFLRAAGINATAAVVAVPRDRVILKEVRFPAVAAHEEPALVRFQVGKELTDSLEASVLDYAARAGTVSGGERQALAVIARRDLVHAVQTLCKSAGLKLLGLAPRPFGVPYALARIAGADVGTETRAALSLGGDWAELGIFRGPDPVLTRSLAVGPTLAAEVRRTLAVHAAQTPDPAGVPTRLHVFGNAAATPASIDETVAVVDPVDPLTSSDDVRTSGGSQGVLAGAVGLAQCWAARGALPINLALQRRVQGPANPARRKYVMAGAVAGVLLLGGFVAMYSVLARKRAEVQSLTFQKNDLEDTLKALAQEKADIEGVKDWDATTIPWIDELYDLSARFPYHQGFRVNHLSTEVTAKKGSKDPHVARIRIAGVTPAGQETLVHQLIGSVARDSHVRGALEKFKGQDFHLKIDVAKQPRDRYAEVLVAPARAKAAEDAADANEDAVEEGGVP